MLAGISTRTEEAKNTTAEEGHGLWDDLVEPPSLSWRSPDGLQRRHSGRGSKLCPGADIFSVWTNGDTITASVRQHRVRGASTQA